MIEPHESMIEPHEPTIEAELFFRLSEDKLRRRGVWAGAALWLSVVMPYEIIDEQPQFLWQVFGELPPAGTMAALSGAVAGGIIVVARYLVRDAVPFAMVVLAAVFGSFICNKLGADASAWGLWPLPQSFAGRATLALIAMSGTAAGTSLARRGHTRRPSQLFILGAVLLAAVFYAGPGRGPSAGRLIVHNLSMLGALPSLRLSLGTLTLSFVALWPGVIAVLGLRYLNRRSNDRAVAMLPLVSVLGFPLILLLLMLAKLARANVGSALYVALGVAMEVAAVMALVSGAFEVLGQTVFNGAAGASPAGGRTRRALARRVKWTGRFCGGLLLMLTVVMSWLARGPEKGVRWALGPSSAGADSLFGHRVAAWVGARAQWSTLANGGGGIAALAKQRMQEEAAALIAEAGRVDAGLATAIRQLVRTGQRSDVSARAWHRAVGLVNAASRDAELPYYLDPMARVQSTAGGLRRRLRAPTFRVMRARRFAVDGAMFGTLHVRHLHDTRATWHPGLLGLSRDAQPYALVEIEAAAAHVLELSEMASTPGRVPRCGRTFEPLGDAILARCGRRLAAMLEHGSLSAAITAKIERHELQHQIDGPLLRMAFPVLEKLTGHGSDRQERVNRELSAYLAQLTSKTSPIHVGLFVPLRLALLQDRGTYHHAAVLLFEALGEGRIRDAHGRVDPVPLAPIFDALMAMDERSLVGLAVRAWERLFREPLPRVELVDDTVAPE